MDVCLWRQVISFLLASNIIQHGGPCSARQPVIRATGSNRLRRERERRANTRPSWSYLAKSAFPEVYHQAQRLLQEQYRRETTAEERATTNQKWAVVEVQIRETMAEEMAAIDALEDHVRFWTVCHPVAIEIILENATTEQERVDVVLGSRMQLLLKQAQGTFAGFKADKASRRSDGSAYDTDESVTFVVELTEKHGRSKGSRRRRRKKENRRYQAVNPTDQGGQILSEAGAKQMRPLNQGI
ncbi:hypothetical protein G647_08196 [Cladophialophora carrionii CBS 160.54]|uniref:Uncharacterized protein n=1 Tax=Cladophialophora carrionii CBS 160.54 TaxID=1279043 RepID=V9D2E6_9EURO|nr:uncharacterized protein G647_08196 [Cladophialophora carrionii CBS 160.54]ETI20162.1 hypothetical protein G647_08196 [Cladophialophora carrionii CBS 160.54]